MIDRLLAFAEAHPETFGLVCTLVLVPLLGSAASFLDAWAAKRWPVAVAMARALLPDVKRAAAILTTRALEKRKLPVPPEVRELAIQRIEKAVEQTASKPPPSPPPPLVMMTLALALAGCSRADVIAGANVHRDAGHATARILAEACDYEAAERLGGDLARERAAQLDAIYCEEAWLAQRAFAAAHRAQVRAIEAAEAGKCVIGAPKSEPACNLLQAAAATYQAGVALADAAAMVRAAARGAR